MNNYKSIFQSTTFWGAVVTLFSILFPTIYAKLGITDQSVLVAQIVGAVGTLVAVYGRFTATKITTLSGKPPQP